MNFGMLRPNKLKKRLSISRGREPRVVSGLDFKLKLFNSGGYRAKLFMAGLPIQIRHTEKKHFFGLLPMDAGRCCPTNMEPEKDSLA